MGHCAPTVMKTVLDAYRADAPWLVKLAAGLPGGIGNCRNECGGITAPLVLLGLRYAREPDVAGVPEVVCRGNALLRAFAARHGTTSCRDILGDARLPLRCVGVVRLAPGRYVEVRSRDCAGALSGECREAYAILHAHLVDRGFHCAHAVLRRASGAEPVEPALLDATAAFAAGTAYAGLTCSALTAGVMLLGLSLGEIEDSPRRVLRMIGIMAAGGDAFADDLNAFNRVMNLGHGLARWFKGQHGSTRCRDITRCDLSTPAGACAFAESGCVARCEAIAGEVASRVRSMVEHERA
jgi:C_GCAxxG_C_C family probable redox protein